MTRATRPLSKVAAPSADLDRVLGDIAEIETPAMKWVRNAAARLREIEQRSMGEM